MSDDNTRPKPGSPEWAAEMQRLSREREAAKEAARIVYLPAWPEARRASPNELVRSALFNVRNHNVKRRDFKDEPIAVFGDATITYRGEELRQDDLDVWLQLLHLARQQPLGEWVEFTPGAMVRVLGWPHGGASYRRLRTCLSRMQATAIAIRSKRLGKGVSVSLVRMFEWQNEGGSSLDRWRVWIEKPMHPLFAEPYYTLLEWDQRKALGPLAKWLHGFYASHAEPYPLKVATLQAACGSEMAATKDFAKKLRRALNELKAAKFLKIWRIEKGLVHVVRA